MEEVQTLDEKPMDYQSNVDSSRPFRSVKEAVAIFGERFLAGEIYSPRPTFAFSAQEMPNLSPSPPKVEDSGSGALNFSPTPPKVEHSDSGVMDTIKKLEAELEETKTELELLKHRETETEVALASLNAELHKSMSKMAQAEAAAAAKNNMATSSRSMYAIRDGNGVEEKRRDFVSGMGKSPSLAEILNAGEKQKGSSFVVMGGNRKRDQRKVMKKKPIIPLVGDLFSRKKGNSSDTMQNPLFASSHVQWN